jgi:ribosomal protein S18 acetylase RimI-like enzyme
MSNALPSAECIDQINFPSADLGEFPCGNTTSVADAIARVRYAEQRDIPRVSALFQAVVGHLGLYSEAAREAELIRCCEPALGIMLANDARAISVAIAHSSDSIVGFCIARVGGQAIWLDWIGIEAGSRRKKFGAALINHLIAEAPLRKAIKINCTTRTTNRASIKLLQTSKFRRVRRWTVLDQEHFLWERVVQER